MLHIRWRVWREVKHTIYVCMDVLFDIKGLISFVIDRGREIFDLVRRKMREPCSKIIGGFDDARDDRKSS